MLFVTLPSLDQMVLVSKIMSHPLVTDVRYNVGMRCQYGPDEILRRISALAKRFGKRVWIDIKGRQLRVEKWADPTYGDIVLNHDINVKCPATVFFRGDESSTVVEVNGNKIYVDPPPPSAIGAGQAVNIIGDGLEIKGEYLTENDKSFIRAGANSDINRLLLSFVEKESDIVEAFQINPRLEVVGLKIESQKGLEYAFSNFVKQPWNFLVFARDDMMINIGDNKAKILEAQEKIIKIDRNAVGASHLFTSLQHRQTPSVADFSDLRLLQLMGYRNFLLSDGISHKHFDKAMENWKAFSEVFGNVSQ